MTETLGYMVTWRTYGTWLRGDQKGHMKNGEVLGKSDRLDRANIERLSQRPVRLELREKGIVRQAILEKARKVGQRILAVAVCSNHVHIVVGYDERPVEETVRRFKNVATVALRAGGMRGKV
ncbi:MAG: transposase, partial [Planctomycetota bacterium]